MALNEQIKPVIEENLTVFITFSQYINQHKIHVYIGDGIIFLFSFIIKDRMHGSHARLRMMYSV